LHSSYISIVVWHRVLANKKDSRQEIVGSKDEDDYGDVRPHKMGWDEERGD